MSTVSPSSSAATRPTLLIPDVAMNNMDEEQAHFSSMQNRYLALVRIHRDLGSALESLRLVHAAIGMEAQHLEDYISVLSPAMSDGYQQPYNPDTALGVTRTSTFSASSDGPGGQQETYNCEDSLRTTRSIASLKAVCAKIKQTLGRVAATN
ncbi:hypothetical protein FKP32DRAFT_1677576 [Trametes sanguinea]|nr:hypothetical protein FKP32DRAFT_1677576 [Trametes sanguinea]